MEFFGSRNWTIFLFPNRTGNFALSCFTHFFVGLLVGLTGADYETARSWLGNPLVAIAALLLIGAAIMHMRIGMQIVIEDYVTGPALRTLSLIANTFFAYAAGIACIYAVAKIGFSA